MVWVSRDATGAVNGVFAVRQPDFATEQLADNDPEVVAVLTIKTIDPVDAWDLVSLKIAFNHENRLRALEGKTAITLTQFKSVVRSQS